MKELYVKTGQYKERIGGILVWFTVERLNIYNIKTKLYDEGDYICYYSFVDPKESSPGKLIKDENSKPLSWKTEKETLKYARQHIKIADQNKGSCRKPSN